MAAEACRAPKRLRNRSGAPELFLVAPPCPRLLGEIAPQPLAHLVGLFRRPGSKALAGLHAELAGIDLLAQERMRPRCAVEVGGEHVADVEREVEPDEVR